MLVYQTLCHGLIQKLDSFEELNDEKIRILVEEIERLIKFKLKYQTTNNNGQTEIKNRAYLPTMHKGKYVGEGY